MSQNTSFNAPVRWTRQHIEELDRMFPEDTSTTNTNEVLINLGTRKVVNAIKAKVKSQERRVDDKTDTLIR